MAEATGSEMVADLDPAGEPGAIRARAVPVGPPRQGREGYDAADHCRTGVGAGHVWLDAVEATYT